MNTLGVPPRIGMSLVQRLQVDRREPRLPIVGVHDRRPVAGSRGELERGPDERSEPERVVGIVSRAGAVQAVAIVELGNIDEQRPRPISERFLEQPDLDRPSAEEKGESLDRAYRRSHPDIAAPPRRPAIPGARARAAARPGRRRVRRSWQRAALRIR